MHTTAFPDTICAISTPAGTGGIAVVRISGPRAIEAASAIWHGVRLDSAESHTAHLGTVIDPDTSEAVDQAVATVYRAPRSYTCDDTVELSVHGSLWVQREVIRLLCRCDGVRLAEAGEFTRRAFAAGRIDLAQAEAVADMIGARSRAEARLALSQLRGSYSDGLARLRQSLLELAALLELELDFSEEDVEFASRSRLRQLAAEVCETLRRLHTSFAAGHAVKEGIPVAIIGATNAGKSSLLNALVGDDRAIVSPVHGTTRDIVEDTLTLGDYRLRLMDTAGLRHTDDPVEAIGIDRSRNAARRAALILHVVDATSPEPVDADTGDTPVLLVINKTDLAPLPPDTPPDAIATSAATGYGIDHLKAAIAATIERQLGLGASPDMIVTNERHAAALARAAEAAQRVINALDADLPGDLIAQDLRETLHHLGEITGAITTPEILATIFSRFCIGK